MNEYFSIPLALAAGLFLGGVFFAGLWWTVRKGLSSRQPARWFFGSLILRMVIALEGFYLVGRGNWKRLVSCLLGFLVARFVVMYFTRAPVERPGPEPGEAGHAP